MRKTTLQLVPGDILGGDDIAVVLNICACTNNDKLRCVTFFMNNSTMTFVDSVDGYWYVIE
jgi:hypothetical protein